jgi:hypothetical protein
MKRTNLSLLAILSLLPPLHAAPEQMMQAPAPETMPKQKIVSLTVEPAKVTLDGKFAAAQVLVTAKLQSGEVTDVTRLATLRLGGDCAEISKSGHIEARKNGAATLTVEISGQKTSASVEVSGVTEKATVDFIRDVNPVMTKLGCNAGTCHGAKDGKYGFKLSLRGYDPIYDVRSLKDDLAGRRLNAASPDDSLMLLKATSGVPHEGGQRTKLGEKYYEILRAWIADGAKLDLGVVRVKGIEVFPKNPVVPEPGARQQFRVVATFSDGKTRDVTAEAFVDSGNGDVAAALPETNALINTLRRGEAPVLARYEGNYAATTLTVMGDRSGFTWKQPETWGRIDELVAAKWQRMKIAPSDVCNDADFLRRVYLDLAGTPPSADEVRAFLSDTKPMREKRDAIIDKLIGSPDFIEHATNKWCDLLQVNSKFLGGQGVQLFRDWIRKEIADNTPYDQFVKKILTASGSNKDNPAASYWKILRDPAETMENTTHLFLATRFNCNKCHDHPFERWTQDQYYHLGAFFSQVSFADDPASGATKLAGTAVEKARALFEIVKDAATGEMIHLRTNKVAEPTFPFPAKVEVPAKPGGKEPRREQLAEWITSPDNRYFASSYVNRQWGYLLGAGIIEPLDDIRAGNPATNPELLEYLTKEFVSHGFDVRHVLREICKSRTYQLALATNKWNEDDKTNYSHALPRRLPAEVLYDSVLKVTGAGSRLPGGVRASMLADSQADLPSGFLANTGRPARESSCECERNSDLRLGSVMALLSGPAIADAIGDPSNALPKLVTSQPDDRRLVDEIFTRVLNRPASDGEIARTLESWSLIEQEHKNLTAALDEKEKEQAPIIAKQEAERVATIDSAKKGLARYEKEIAPKVADAEKKRKESVVAAAAAVKDYEQKNVAAAQARFETTVPIAKTYTGWVPLDLLDPKATGGVELAKQADGSIRASGPAAKNTDYTVLADTKLAGITGVMLEVLTDATAPGFGPGYSTGNFVLGEIGLKTGPLGKGRQIDDAKFNGAVADVSQANFEVAKAIDDKKGDGNNGWAVSPQFGVPHYAAFSLAKPIGDAEKGLRLRFELNQPRAGGFSIARFRIYVTTGNAPLNIGLPIAVTEALKKPAQLRSKEDKAAIAAYWNENDPELRKRRLTLARNEMPLPTDPGIVERHGVLAKSEEPIRIDPKLVQLRADVAQSKTQLANRRLTGAQDLVWALVNTPAFLFNR